MKVVSTDGLTKLIQLIKSSFISNTDVETTSEVTLATVATTGSYNDLSGRPTIPTVDQTYDGTSANAQSGVAMASAISGKADVDLTNVNANGKSLASGLGMPSTSFISLTVGVSGATYTAPANGYFRFDVGGDSFCVIYGGIACGFASSPGQYGAVSCPVKTGTVVSVYYSGTITAAMFVYAKGEV